MEISERSEPYRHWVIDGAIPETHHGSDIIRDMLRSIPPPDWPGWIRYNNDLEKKLACTPGSINPIPGQMFPIPFDQTIQRFFESLRSWTWLAFLQNLTGIPNLQADSTSYGGGLHLSQTGDSLGCHLDFSIHPATGLERRLNQLVYLNQEWKSEWGGETQFYDFDARHISRVVEPKPRRILLWECSEVAYHGAAPVTGSTPRLTAAIYYYTQPRPGCSPRRRALFVPKR